MIALIGITIERKVRSSSRKANPSTNANTIGARDFIVLLKSTLAAVAPVTACSVPTGSVASTGGITWVRRVSSARTAVASCPSPASGKSTRATVFALLTATRIGCWITPVARARFLNSAYAFANCGVVTSSALTTRCAGSWEPGKDAWIVL